MYSVKDEEETDFSYRKKNYVCYNSLNKARRDKDDDKCEGEVTMIIPRERRG